jgi:hypothetical protein
MLTHDEDIRRIAEACATTTLPVQEICQCRAVEIRRYELAKRCSRTNVYFLLVQKAPHRAVESLWLVGKSVAHIPMSNRMLKHDGNIRRTAEARATTVQPIQEAPCCRIV